MSAPARARVEVRGNATAEELAAVLVTLGQAAPGDEAPSRYEMWRARRIAALARRSPGK